MGRDLRGYKLRKYRLDWRVAGWQEPQRAGYRYIQRAYSFRRLLDYIPGIATLVASCAVSLGQANSGWTIGVGSAGPFDGVCFFKSYWTTRRASQALRPSQVTPRTPQMD